jgi:tetratricopeptide (TPR) repeat protein
MNKLSLLLALTLGVSASHFDHAEASVAHANANAKKLHRSGDTTRGPAARTAVSPWEASYNAEATGRLETALDVLAELPPAERNAYLASYRRGWLLYRLGRYAESVSAYRIAVSQEPAAIEGRVALQLPLMALTKWNDVTQVAEEVLKVDPENYLTMQRLALAKYSTQHYPEAEALYRRVLMLYPSDIETRACLGWTLLRMGKQPQAVAMFNQVLAVSSLHVSATQGLQEASGRKAGH